MKSLDPPPGKPAPPPGNPTKLLDHAPQLLNIPSIHKCGGSYQEMLSQLGHHLEDLGGILLAHAVGKEVSPASVISASPTCCSMACVSHKQGGTPKAKAAVAYVNAHSALSSRNVQTKALEAVQRKIQSHLLFIKEQERNDKLWELLKGAKNLPPPVSPWLSDPAVTGNGNGVQHAKGTSLMAKETGLAPSPGSSTGICFDSKDTNASGVRFDSDPVWPTIAIPVKDVVEQCKETNNKDTLNSARNREPLNSARNRVAMQVRKSMGAKPEGLDGFLARKSVGAKNIELRSQAAKGNRKTVEMLLQVAKAASLPNENRPSEKKLLIGNGRRARQEQRKIDRAAAMEEFLGQLYSRNQDESTGFSLQDCIVALVILTNALVMGISADIQWQVGWDVLEYVFTGFFLGEMMLKMRKLGLRNYFLGNEWTWNLFDFVVVMIALVDLTIGIVLKMTNAGDSVDLSKFTAVKLARLGRLARLIRLLRFKMFKELKAMVTGVFAGLHVLMWAIILFFSFIFFLAMVLRNIYVDEEWEYMKESFGTTPWAMFTLFRCFTDGCSAHDGTPLIVHFYLRYGAYFVIGYMLVFLFVTIGLFNLIMAIFIDNVMESTKSMKKVQRESNHQALEGRLRQIVMKVVRRRWKHLIKIRKAGLARDMSKEACKAASIESAKEEKQRASIVRYVPDEYPRFQWFMVKTELWLRRCCCKRPKKEKEEEEGENDEALPRDEDGDVIIDRELFNLLIEDPQMDEMMEHLDIVTSNRWELFDVLDADMSGHLGMEELIVGFMNLRGPTEKSDTVATLLAVRQTLHVVQDLVEDQEEFALEAMGEMSAILSGVQILARFLLPGGDQEQLDQMELNEESRKTVEFGYPGMQRSETQETERTIIFGDESQIDSDRSFTVSNRNVSFR